MNKVFGIALAWVLAAAAPAHAQKPTLNNTARASSLFAMLIKHCPGTNVKTAGRFRIALSSVGTKLYSKDTYEKELAAEMPRRAQEVEKAGKDKWCEENLASAEKMGVKDIRIKK